MSNVIEVRAWRMCCAECGYIGPSSRESEEEAWEDAAAHDRIVHEA